MESTIKHIYRASDTDHAEDESATMEVVELMTNGDQYTSTFLPYAGIDALQRTHAESGAFLSGAYFWSKNLVLVADCRAETVERVVRAILEDGELGVVFERV